MHARPEVREHLLATQMRKWAFDRTVPVRLPELPAHEGAAEFSAALCSLS
jgi:hypothetical protein